jgi:hypothetical protein
VFLAGNSYFAKIRILFTLYLTQPLCTIVDAIILRLTPIPNLSSQNLKDYMRQGGDVVSSHVDQATNTGVVEFRSKEEMLKAIRELDDTELRTPLDTRRIKIKMRDEYQPESGSSDRSRSFSGDREREKNEAPSPLPPPQPPVVPDPSRPEEKIPSNIPNPNPNPKVDKSESKQQEQDLPTERKSLPIQEPILYEPILQEPAKVS